MNQSWELCITDGLRTHFCPFLGPFCPKSREQKFSQIWDFCRKLANHNTLHFRSFLAKTNDSILRKSPKTLFLPYFCPFLGPFCPKSREREFSQIWDLLRKLANHKTLHFRWFLAKTNYSIFRKSPKTLFLGHFGPFWALFAHFWENGNFPKKSGFCHFSALMDP